MKRLSIILVLVFSTVGLAADWIDGILTDYVCQDYMRVTHKKELRRPDPSVFNIPGRGVLKEWKLEQSETGRYTLFGHLISNNTGFRKQGVPIYTGNLSLTNIVRLMALSDADGNFKFRLNSYRNAKTQEEADKYLYVGQRYTLLMQYEIPYKDVQQRKSSVRGKPRR